MREKLKKAKRHVYPYERRTLEQIRAFFLKKPWFKGSPLMPVEDWEKLRAGKLTLVPKRHFGISCFIDGWLKANE